MSNEEDQIETKGKTPPRVTQKLLDAEIDTNVPVQYHVFPGTPTTVCLVTLKNGFTVVGESTAVSLEKFDEAIGREVAFKDARMKLWPLLGFAIRERLNAESKARSQFSEPIVA